MSLYDRISVEIIRSVSEDEVFIKTQKEIASKEGFKKLINRDVELQLRTGTKIKFNSKYAKTVPKTYKGSRHLAILLFATMKSSPTYSSITCYRSVICPSFEVSKDAVKKMGVKANYDDFGSIGKNSQYQ